jgi:hypothetical protein
MTWLKCAACSTRGLALVHSHIGVTVVVALLALKHTAQGTNTRCVREVLSCLAVDQVDESLYLCWPQYFVMTTIAV